LFVVIYFKHEKYLVMGDSIVFNAGAAKANTRVECFPGIRSDQLKRVVENRATERRDLGNPDAVVIHVGTNDIKRSRNLDYVMGDIYDLINTTKSTFSSSRVILSGVLRRSDVSSRRIGAANDRLEWAGRTLGVTFVDPNSWVEDWDFKGDGLHLNRREAQHLGQMFERVCGVGDGGHERRGT
jgi:lysophospholipase L1-like esterase